MPSPKVAIIVPTLGLRGVFLEECLRSVRRAGDCHVLLVAPPGFNYQILLQTGLIDQYVRDPGNGLAAAINHAERALPRWIEYMNWLGDDDLLAPSSLSIAVQELEAKSAEFVWGACEYIDSSGASLGTNRSGYWAIHLMRVGPDLVPQPGALFRRSLFQSVGALDESYRLAFDFDLFMKFSKTGKCIYLPEVLAKYRWHDSALSAGSRSLSVREARRVRRSHLPTALRPLSVLWEYPVSALTHFAGVLVSRRARSGTY